VTQEVNENNALSDFASFTISQSPQKISNEKNENEIEDDRKSLSSDESYEFQRLKSCPV